MKDRHSICIAAFVICMAATACAWTDEMDLSFSGRASLGITRIQKSSLEPDLDVGAVDAADAQDVKDYYSGAWIQTVGGSVGALARVGERFSFSTSLGGFIWHPIQTGEAGFKREMNRRVSAWVTGANAKIVAGNIENPPLEMTVGLFGINSSPDVKNFGGYLFKGGVYPGYLYNGGGGAGLTGIRFHNGSFGNLEQDLLLLTETSQYPYFDFSIAYLVSYEIAEFLNVGAGINLYRLIPAQRSRTEPVHWIDTATGQSGHYSLAGEKVMGRITLDFQRFIQSEWLGEAELRLYAEAAVFGLRDQREHQRRRDSVSYVVFDNVWERIPVVAGFNLPTFRLLDRLCVELEYYGSPHDYRDQNNGNPLPSTIPTEMSNGHQDDIRWAVCFDRTFLSAVRVGAKVASDHFRTWDERGWSNPEVFTLKPDEWYWSLNLGLSF